MNKVFMMIGVSGSGKSTVARKANVESNGQTKIISSDDIREELYGDASIQKNPNVVFDIAYNRVTKAIKEGFDVVFDATNLTKKNRKFFFNALKKAGVRDKVCVIACVVKEPIEVCIARQQRRTRKVPKEVIERQMKQMEMPEREEGFDMIAFFGGEYEEI